MPAVAALSEFNRNQTEVLARLKETEQPLYLTRNGRSAVVVMDADAFDRMVSHKERAREHELVVYENLVRGYEDVQQGKVSSASDAFARIRAKKGW